MTRNLDARLSTHSSTAIAVFRVVVGLLFLCHGLSQVFGWPVPRAAPLGEWPWYYAGLIELVTSVLVILGLFTRIAALVASGAMAYAYFTVHLPHGFLPMTNGGELAVLYCFAFLLLAFVGSGRHALETRRSGIGARWRRPRGAYADRPAVGAGRRGRRAGAPWNRRRADLDAPAAGAGWRGTRAGGLLNRWRRSPRVRRR